MVLGTEADTIDKKNGFKTQNGKCFVVVKTTTATTTATTTTITGRLNVWHLVMPRAHPQVLLDSTAEVIEDISGDKISDRYQSIYWRMLRPEFVNGDSGGMSLVRNRSLGSQKTRRDMPGSEGDPPADGYDASLEIMMSESVESYRCFIDFDENSQ